MTLINCGLKTKCVEEAAKAVTQQFDFNSPAVPAAIVFANFKGNLGDFAIVHAMLLDILKHQPDRSVHVYVHGFVSVDDRRLEAFKAAAPSFVSGGATFADMRAPHRILRRMLRLLRLDAWHQGARIRSLTTASVADAGHFSQYHAVYIAGGAQWTGTTSGVAMFATLRAIAAHTDRIFAYPFSVSPSLAKVNTPSGLRHDFSLIRGPLIARDSASRDRISDLGISSTLGSDCVFSLAETAQEVAAADHGSRRRVIFIVTGQGAEALATALQAASAAGLEAVVLSTCAIEDAAVQKPVADAAGVEFLAPLTWQECVAELKASQLVVTNRLHGLIMSSFAGVPVLPLTDRSKVQAVVRDAELPLSIPVLGVLDSEMISAGLAQREAIVAKIEAYATKARRAAYSPLSEPSEG